MGHIKKLSEVYLKLPEDERALCSHIAFADLLLEAAW